MYIYIYLSCIHIGLIYVYGFKASSTSAQPQPASLKVYVRPHSRMSEGLVLRPHSRMSQGLRGLASALACFSSSVTVSGRFSWCYGMLYFRHLP